MKCAKGEVIFFQVLSSVYFYFFKRKMGTFVPSSYAINLLMAYVEILFIFSSKMIHLENGM